MRPDKLLGIALKAQRLDPNKGTIVEAMNICPFCKKAHSVKLYMKDWLAFKAGQIFIQDIKYLTPAERELLVSGTDEECWNKYMKCSDE